jgi:YD repeat-containing protein
MVAVVTGAGLGLDRSSGLVLGSRGQLGDMAFGRYGENVAVNAANGNLLISRTDEILIGQGPDDDVTRAYNSQGTFGNDWQFSAQRTVTGLTGTVDTAGSTVTRTDWDGSQTVYTYNAGLGAYVSPQGEGAQDTLSFASNVWTWTSGSSQATETYDDLNGGRITASTDTNGNQLTYSYTGSQLTRIATASGEYTDFTWSGGNVTQIATHLSGGVSDTLVRYTYDSANRLATVTTDLTPGDNSVADGAAVTTSYTYDGTSNRVASISQTGGAELDIAYTLVGSDYRVTSLTQTLATGVTSTTSFAYDTTNNVTTVTDAQGQATKLTYDAQGQLTRMELPPAQSGAAAQVLTYTYDAGGNVLTATDALGNTVTYGYDADGNMTLMRDALGNTVTRTYDAANRLLTETSYRVPDPDGAGSGQPSEPATVRYAYDSHGNLRFAVSADGDVTEYTYNAAGQQTAAIVYRDNTYDLSSLTAADSLSESVLASWASAITDKSVVERTDTTYDFRGNISTVTSYSQAATDGSGLTSQPVTTVTYVYDQFGNLLSRHTSGQANSEIFSYDGLGRVVSSTDLNGAATTVAFNDGQNKSVVTLASGLVETSTYNLAGELISYTQSGTGITAGTASYAYDDMGNLRMVTDALGNKSYYLYDAVGRKVADIAADGSFTEYRYDADNRLVATIGYAAPISSAALASLVDGSGNPTNVSLASIRPVATAADAWNWSIYDAAGNVIESIDADGDVSVFAYDGQSNLVSTTSYAAPLTASALTALRTTLPTSLQLPSTTAGKDDVSRDFYDEDGRLIGALDGDGYLSQIVYNAAGEKSETIAYATATSTSLRASGSFADLLTSAGTSTSDVHNRYFYDGRGLLQYTLNNALRPTEYTYDATGNLLHTTSYGDSIAANSSYSAAYVAGQISSLSLASNSATRISYTVYDGAGRADYTIDAAGDVTAYAYDASGNVVKQTQFAALFAASSDPSLSAIDSWASSQASNSDNRTTRMVYDQAGRPVYTVDAAGYISENRYDADGRVTQTIRYADAYSVSDSVTQASLAAQIGSIPSTAVQTSVVYDVDGRVVDSYDGAGVRTHFVYDTLGRVTDKTVAYGTAAAVTCHYTYDAAGRVLTQAEAYGQPDVSTTSYSYDGLGNVLSQTDGRGNVTSYTYDALGQALTVTTPIDASTNAVTTNQYDAFGNVIKATDALGNSSYFYYDSLNRLTLQIDAEGYATKTNYTIGNEVASVTHYATAVSGTVTASTPPAVTTSSADETTTFTRDKLGRVTQQTDAEGYYEQYTLDAFGDQVSVRNQLGGITTNVFDKRGLLTSETLPMSSTRADGSVEATSVTNTYQYDARGNRTQMIEAAGLSEQRTTNYTYDKLDRLIQTSGDAVSVTGSGYNLSAPAVPVTSVVYDARGNVIETTDPTGAKTFDYYDDFNRKIAEVNAVGVLSTWAYDQDGNVTAQRVYGDAVALPGSAGGAAPSPVSGLYRQTAYTYDDAGRLLTTTVANLRVGQYNSPYVTSVTNVTITNVYDKNGNLVHQIDGDGNSVWYYYDKLSRKVAEVDQANYLTRYTLDADGNVTTEVRYATALAASPDASSTASGLSALVSASSDDRATVFTYDKNGRRLTEQRLNVAAWNVNASNGSLSAASTTAVVSYSYNGLGEVTRKTEATGDYTDYSYDQSGRQTTVTDSAFGDYTGMSVQNVNVQSYDGLNNLVRSVQDGARATTYSYGAGGRLASTTDASGFVTNYRYDADGRVTLQYYDRLLSNGSSVTEGAVTNYDLLGRAVMQAKVTLNGDSWSLGDQTQTQYNAYGEVSATGTNGLQTNNAYDNGGRLIRSTADDGTVKLYVYDANGNRTLEITSDGGSLPAGYSWSSLTVDQALALLTGNGAHPVAAAAVPGMVVTIMGYDARGQETLTAQPLRQLDANTTTDIVNRWAYDAFGEVVQKTDPNGNPTNYVYNTLGKVVQQISPTVNETDENGTIESIRPTQTNYYDLSGRLVGTRDANGNYNTRVLLSGTGYGSADASVVKEFHADGGVVTDGYDVFSDLRQTTNEVGSVESFAYDAMDRLVADTHPTRAAGTAGNNTGSNVTLVDYYAYDGLGQRIKHWNNQYGASAAETTDYDMQGRVTRTTDMAGNATTYTYAWSSSVTTAGLGNFGGWVRTTTNPSGLTSTDYIDVFGREVSSVDFGGHNVNYTFDQAGRVARVNDTTTGQNTAYTYYNTGNIEYIDNYASTSSSTTTSVTTTGTTVEHPGDTWVPGDPGYTDSWGNTYGATPGQWENITTSHTETQGGWIAADPGYTDSWGNTYGATPGHYATDTVDVTTNTINTVTTTTTTEVDATTTTAPDERTTYQYDSAGNKTYEGYANTVLTDVSTTTTTGTTTATSTEVDTTTVTDGVTSTTTSGYTYTTATGYTHPTVTGTNHVWVPPTGNYTDSWGNVYQAVDTSHYETDTGYNTNTIHTTQQETLTGYNHPTVTGTNHVWVPPTGNYTDSWGNVYQAVDTSHYETRTAYSYSTATGYNVNWYLGDNQTTEQVWVPPSGGYSDSWGNVYGQTPGYYTNVTVDNYYWYEVDTPYTYTVATPYTYQAWVTSSTEELAYGHWADVPYSYTVATPYTYQVTVPYTYTTTTPYTYQVWVTSSTEELAYGHYEDVPYSYTVATPYTYQVATPWTTTNATPYHTNTSTTSTTSSSTSSNTSSTTTSETTPSTSYESENITYDAMNRVTSINDGGYNNTAPISINMEYDANGNVRRRDTTYRSLDANGNPAATGTIEDDWYEYDSMNRFVLTQGTFNGSRGSGNIARGDGTSITYNAASERVSSAHTVHYAGSSYTDSWGNTYSTSADTYADQEEIYTYTADGYLAQVNLALGAASSDAGTVTTTSQVWVPENPGYTDSWGNTVGASAGYWENVTTTSPAPAGLINPPAASGSGTLLASYALDAMGRTTTYDEYDQNSGSVVYSRDAAYDASGDVTSDVVTSVRSAGIYVSSTSYAYSGGLQTSSTSVNTLNGGSSVTSQTTNGYVWWGGAMQGTTTVQPDVTSGTTNTSTFTYDNQGHLVSVNIQDGQPRTISYVTNAQGEILKRDVAFANGSTTGPHEEHYYLNGQAIGDVTNNGTSNTDYVTSIAAHTATQGYGPFADGSDTANPYADFDQSYDPINGFDSADTSSRYTVVQGDTLQNIAQALWGDSSLWYLIADANGLAGNSSLQAGQSLIIPNKVHNVHNSASTYSVYDPNEAIGDTSPTAQAKPVPPPPVTQSGGGGCGIIGQIIKAVVTIVVTVVTGDPVVGDAVGQLFSMAVGIQKGFNWNELGMAAVTAAVTGGLDVTGGFADTATDALGETGGAIATGVAASAISQGIGVATGLQQKFDWTGVAAAGISAGVAQYASSQLPGASQPIFAPNTTQVIGHTLPSTLNVAISGMAGTIANAATRSLVDGSDFGDNIIAGLPDVLSQIVQRQSAVSSFGIGGSSTGFPGMDARLAVDDDAEADTSSAATQLQASDFSVPQDDLSGLGQITDSMTQALAQTPSLNYDTAYSGVGGGEDSASFSNAADYSGLSPDIANENSALPTETVTVTGIRNPQLSERQLYQRYWGSLENAQNKRNLPKEVKYSFQPNYAVSQVRTTGVSDEVKQTKYFSTRSDADNFLAQHTSIITNKDGSTVFWGEMNGLTTGPNQATIYAGAVDPSQNGYTVYHPAVNGKPEINVQLDPGVWQEVSINTLFHEAYHAIEEAAGDPQSGNEYNARAYSLTHMTKGGYP